MSAPLRICHLYPELLNLYGDSGNILCLKKRLEWRGIPVAVDEVHVGDTPNYPKADLVFIGGGSDREQKIVCDFLLASQKELKAYVEDEGVLLAVCGGYQLLGHSYLMGEETVQGLSLVDLYTDRGEPRLIGNIAIRSKISEEAIIGYENHGGRTHLGSQVEPLGELIFGFGNDGTSGVEGCLYKNLVGTYIHGPLLPKNPGVADWLLARALERSGQGLCLDDLPLDDNVELSANRAVLERFQK